MESSRRHENEHQLPISPEVTAAFAPFELGSVRQMFPGIFIRWQSLECYADMSFFDNFFQALILEPLAIQTQFSWSTVLLT